MSEKQGGGKEGISKNKKMPQHYRFTVIFDKIKVTFIRISSYYNASNFWVRLHWIYSGCLLSFNRGIFSVPIIRGWIADQIRSFFLSLYLAVTITYFPNQRCPNTLAFWPSYCVEFVKGTARKVYLSLSRLASVLEPYVN